MEFNFRKLRREYSLEKLFHLKEHGTNVRTEIIAGITTFLTMAYIIFLNPTVIGHKNTGMADTAVVTATCIGAAIGTWLIGWLSNYPMAQAPGLGLNAVFAYTLCGQFGLSAPASLAAVFIGGVFFIFLTVTGARKAIVEAIPYSLKKAISAGIGLFIAIIGFSNANIVIGQKSGAPTIVDLASFENPQVLLALFGLIVTTILVIKKVKAGIFLGMVITAVAGNILQFCFGQDMGITAPTTWAPNLDFSMFGKCFTGFGELFSAPIASLIAVLITLVLVDMFDTIGTLIGAADKAGYLDENGACFALALFASPLVGLVPTAATAPILIIVGIMMCSALKDIDWGDMDVAFPCFFTLVGMPFFWSITDGIAFGFISYLVVKMARGKFKEIHPLMYTVVGLFILMYVLSALQALKIL